MKLRQKLAVVLASAMIITAVPVVTSAASTNGFNKTLSIVADKEITTAQGLNLTVKYDDSAVKTIANGTKDTFFVNATDFKFLNDTNVYTGVEKDGVTITRLSDTQLKVEVKAGTNLTGKELEIAIAGTPSKGTPAIIVDAEDSLATSGKYALSTSEIVTDKVLTATAGDVKNISIDGYGSIADITIEEKAADTLLEKGEVTITLPNSSELNFNSTYKTAQEIEIAANRGLSSASIKATAKYFEDANGKQDSKKLVITLTGNKTASRGSVVIKGIKVEAEDKKADVATGEVKVTVKANGMEDTKLVVANVADFGVKLNVKEEVEVVAGKDGKTVKVTLEESAIDSLNKKQNVYFTVDGAKIDASSLKIVEGAKDIITAAKADDEVELTLDASKLTADAINKVVFEFAVEGKAANTGDIVLKAESRALENDIEVKLGTVKEAVKVEAQPMTVKVGLKGQKGGQVVITETDAEMLPRGEQIIVEVAKDSTKGINVTDATVEAKDVEIKDVKVEDGKIFFTIARTSEEAGTITIKDITVDTDRTVPEGSFDLVIGGKAISKDNTNKVSDSKDAKYFEDAITVADFFVVGTPNTEDNAANGLKKGTGIFKVGEKSYTVNGEAKEMDAAPYIAKSNRVMVPVRYVSDVFGINGNDVLFSNENGGTITIFAGNKVLQVVNGSNIALVNGVRVPMDEKVSIVDGRTYVPVGEMGRLLGVDVEWSNETKTATFSNK
ncbi:copper amine oxidase N-terminal domain-containing protein [Niameybacter massiliensis]|uniref:Copper amine oxidase N-terminal domain-containing protein n=1 Tax=Holtiella tumoricola TaxID=3018743 RepID=A0AA42DR19_9FIRM|nr:copper amine oxidase N-terminal domain-containing protein [Holtiella tumoricola]MDA3733227.1 copper amine oxidase N-terminal domain-containing protein [Holtiella tumoricola]